MLFHNTECFHLEKRKIGVKKMIRCVYVVAFLQEAANLGKKVMVLDYVIPSPRGTTWGELLCSGFSALTYIVCWYNFTEGP